MKKKNILFIFSVLGMLASNFVMSASKIGQPLLSQYGDGTGMLDFKFFYTKQQAFESIVTMGNEGQHIYVRLLFIDFVFIACTAYFFTTLFSWVCTKFNLSKNFSKLKILGVLRSCFDGMENILLLIFIMLSPSFDWILSIAGIFTFLKWVAMAIYIVALIFAIIIGIFKLFKNKSNY